MFHHILVALDHSAISAAVYAEAIALAKATNAKLMLLHVLSPADEGYPLPIYPGIDGAHPSLYSAALNSYDRQWETFQRDGLSRLQMLVDRALAAGIPAEFSQNFGDAGRTICQVARTWNADLILLGRRGRSGLSELLLGSVSNYVLHHAHCSVLTVQGAVNQSETDQQLVRSASA
jgi:nucleotide-binding universal stress UspA family protein